MSRDSREADRFRILTPAGDFLRGMFRMARKQGWTILNGDLLICRTTGALKAPSVKTITAVQLIFLAGRGVTERLLLFRKMNRGGRFLYILEGYTITVKSGSTETISVSARTDISQFSMT